MYSIKKMLLVGVVLSLSSWQLRAQTVTAVSPTQNAQQVARTTTITVTFSATMAAANISSSTFTVKGEQTGFYTGTYSGGGTQTITFTPVQAFKAGEVITVTLSTGLGISSSYSWQFTTAANAVEANFVTMPAITTSANGAYSVYAADVDGDGDMDVLSASYDDDKIAWYENDGDETFTAHTITTSADEAISVYAADVDGDGDMDVLSASHGDEKIAWYENDGDETFTAHTITTSTNGAYSVYAADVDGDGDMDVLSASLYDDKIAWYENDGSETFTTHTITTSAEGASSVYAADVDGDGDMDVLSASYLDDIIAWYENDGSETFTTHTIATSVNWTYSVYAADVDGDGDMDVLSASWSDNKIAWYENDGDETFTAHTIITSAKGVYSVYAADVDGDGAMDVLSASSSDDKIAWYENDGDETFTTHTITTSADGAYSVYAADVDGDGDMDVLSASYVDDKIAWYINNLPPVIAGTEVDQEVNDHATLATFQNVTLTDSDDGQTLTLTVTLDDANKGSFTTASLTAAGFTDAGSGTYTFSGTADEAQTALQQLVFAPTAGRLNIGESETAVFTLTADDAISPAVTDLSTTVIIYGVNEAPAFTAGSEVTIDEGTTMYSATWATNLSVGPADEATQTLTFLVSNDNADLFSVPPAIDATGTLTFTPADLNVFGEATVTVVLQDNGGTDHGGVDQTAAVTFTITIISVNDAPTFTAGGDVAVPEDAGAYSQTWATNLYTGSDYETDQTLTFSVTHNNTNLFSDPPALDNTGTLTFTPAADMYGAATVTVILQDDGGTDNGGVDQSNAITFTITVNSVNDAPLIDAVDNVIVNINSAPFTITLTGMSAGANEADQTLNLSAASNNTSLLPSPEATLAGDGTGTLTLAPKEGVAGEVTITLTLQDDGGTDYGGIGQTTITFTLTVEEVVQALFIPTLFSPNGDGENDVFRVRGAGIANIRLAVYSADGHEVFSTTDVNTATETGWNGQYQGRNLPAGTYTWTLKGHDINGAALRFEGSPYGQVILLR